MDNKIFGKTKKAFRRDKFCYDYKNQGFITFILYLCYILLYYQKSYLFNSTILILISSNPV